VKVTPSAIAIEFTRQKLDQSGAWPTVAIGVQDPSKLPTGSFSGLVLLEFPYYVHLFRLLATYSINISDL
jgi:hypothetical protein